ncbi:AI-2E family transporter [Peptoniphilus equinus]|uniref:AI-2E family transporter n=1 Tax=Peptoniphilus equinus TaxID=3016343 RepID=A0ABY7QVF7_9FIRM|nr:AI-2E family transporter [Peptoniphilus equinus]WBW50326.1 AI-2E family transporter [Peptoniphilus equinus]
MEQLKLDQINVGNLTPEFFVVGTAALVSILLFLSIYYLINIGNGFIAADKRIRVDLKAVMKVFIALVVLYVFRLILGKYSVVADTLWAIFFGVILSFVINPVVTYLETNSIPRNWGVVIVYVSMALILGILLVIVIPKTINELTNLLMTLPSLLESSNVWFNKLIGQVAQNNNLGLDLNQIIRQANNAISQSVLEIQDSLIDSLKNVGSGVGVVFSKLLRIVLMFIFSFYFTVDKNKFKRRFVAGLPEHYKDDALYLATHINQALLNFVKGRLLLAVFVGFLTMLYLLVLQVDFAVVIGFITMIADIIPYIGPFMGFLPAVLFALMESPFKAMWVAILFVLVQWAENNLLAPKLIGDKTGLSPILVLIAILIGGGVFGVMGMILSVPVLAVILILVDYFKIKYNEMNSKVL